MRDSGASNERIDLIAADRTLFVDIPAKATPRSRQILKGTGFLVAIGLVAAVWWPRSEPARWQVYESANVPVVGLNDQLVFDDPVGQLVVADLAPSRSDADQPALGYVFAEPGRTMQTGRWASFRSHTTNRNAPQTATDGPVVAGVHADVRTARVRHDIEWGPVDGRKWFVSTNRFTDDEAIEFANHVAVIEGRPALARRYGLGAMEPVGSIAAFDCVVALVRLLDGDRVLGAVMPTVLKWATASAGPPHIQLEGASTVGSIAAPPDVLPLVEFVLGNGVATVIHDQRAVMIASNEFGPLVAWLENGRLILVAADLATEKLIELAESVRRVNSDGEWRSIQRAATQGLDYGFSTDVPRVVTVYRAVDPDTGTMFVVTVATHFFFGDPAAMITCADERSASGALATTNCNLVQGSEIPLLRLVIDVNGRQYAIAIVDAAEAADATLRVELANGTFRTIPLRDFGPDVAGWVAGAMLPADYRVVELWLAGEMVASLTPGP